MKKVLNTLGRIEVCAFALVWMGFGVAAFVQIYAWELEHRRKLEAIQRGEVQPETLHIVNLNEHWKDEQGRLIDIGRSKAEVVATRRVASLAGLEAGEEVQAYRFGDNYYLPRFDHYPAWGKFVFLAFALLPLPVVIGVLVVRCWAIY